MLCWFQRDWERPTYFPSANSASGCAHTYTKMERKKRKQKPQLVSLQNLLKPGAALVFGTALSQILLQLFIAKENDYSFSLQSPLYPRVDNKVQINVK